MTFEEWWAKNSWCCDDSEQERWIRNLIEDAWHAAQTAQKRKDAELARDLATKEYAIFGFVEGMNALNKYAKAIEQEEV